MSASKSEPPITFEGLSYALFDVEANAVLITAHGNLAIFSTRGMANHWARSSSRNVIVKPVTIRPATEQ